MGDDTVPHLTEAAYRDAVETQAADLAQRAREAVDDGMFDDERSAILVMGETAAAECSWLVQQQDSATNCGAIIEYGTASPSAYGGDERVAVDGNFRRTLEHMAAAQFGADVINTALAEDE